MIFTNFMPCNHISYLREGDTIQDLYINPDTVLDFPTWFLSVHSQILIRKANSRNRTRTSINMNWILFDSVCPSLSQDFDFLLWLMNKL